MRDAISDDFINKLRSEADIINVISGYIPLKKKGRNYWGCCPFHNEKTPSFSVTPDKGFFYCFGCQAGGNVFNFLMKIENISFYEAVKLLANKQNIPVPEKAKTESDLQKERELAKIYHISDLAKDFFHACLVKTSLGKAAREYLADRGVTADIINSFAIGFAPPMWDKLTVAFGERGYDGLLLAKAGLAVARNSGDGYYDRFRNRIMFPIRNAKGQVVGFGGRVLDNSQPKYLNSPETPVFNKRNVLYGLDVAYKYIKETDQAIVVEGYMDLITTHSAGIRNAVASLGTAFTADQAKKLLHYGREIIFAYDNDGAGQNATLRALNTVRALGAAIKVISIPDGKDPDEFIRKHGPQQFHVLVSEAKGLLEYQIMQAINNIDYNGLEGKIAVIARVLPALASADNAIEVDAHIAKLSQLLAIDESSIRNELRKYIRSSTQDKNVNMGKNNITIMSSSPNQAVTTAERNLIRIMFDYPMHIPHIQEYLSEKDISSDLRREIINCLLTAYNMEKNVVPAEVAVKLSEAANGELSNIMLIDHDLGDITRVVNDCIKIIRLTNLKLRFEQHCRRADELQRMGDSRFLQELAESQRINDEISKLHLL